jgi:glutaredoxin
VFFWFGPDGGTHLASRVDEVPASFRRAVRVDPPRPEQRPPGWIYLTNLERPNADGSFPLRAVRTDEVAQELARLTGLRDLGSPVALAPTPGPAGSRDAGAAGQRVARGEVVIYGASWCSACHQAAAYLRQRNVAFVEKDIEQDPAAQEEMADKARRAGVPLGSIPILDVRGHILRGFSPPEIDRALAGG